MRGGGGSFTTSVAKLLVFNKSYDFLHQLSELENFTALQCWSSDLTKVF